MQSGVIVGSGQGAVCVAVMWWFLAVLVLQPGCCCECWSRCFLMCARAVAVAGGWVGEGAVWCAQSPVAVVRRLLVVLVWRCRHGAGQALFGVLKVL